MVTKKGRFLRFIDTWKDTVAVCAIVLGVVDRRSQRKQDRFSVQPRFSLTNYSALPNGEFGFAVHNVGLGPSEIEEVRFFFDGEKFVEWAPGDDIPPIAVTVSEKVRMAIIEGTGGGIDIPAIDRGTSFLPIIEAGKESYLLQQTFVLPPSTEAGVQLVLRPEIVLAAQNAMKRVRIEVDYIDMYGEEQKTAYLRAVLRSTPAEEG